VKHKGQQCVPSQWNPLGCAQVKTCLSRKNWSMALDSVKSLSGSPCHANLLLLGVIAMVLAACGVVSTAPKVKLPITLPATVRERGPDGEDHLVCEIRDVTVIRGIEEISGVTIRILGTGALVLVGADSRLCIRDCQLEWIIDDSTPADFAPVVIEGGTLEVERVRSVVTDHISSAPTSSEFNGPPMRALFRARAGDSVSIKAVDARAQGPVPVMFLHCTSPRARISIDGVHLSRMGAGVYLGNFSTAVIQDFAAEDCNMASIAALTGDSLVVTRAFVRRQGRFDSRGLCGTGDGITLDCVQSAVVRNSSFVDGGCYGMQVLGGRVDLVLDGCELSGGVTHAIYSDRANSADLVSERSFRMNGCRFIGNVGSDYCLVGFGLVDVKGARDSDGEH
jgi:hypothetical protein